MNKADIIAKLAPKLYITQDEARVILNSVNPKEVPKPLVAIKSKDLK